MPMMASCRCWLHADDGFMQNLELLSRVMRSRRYQILRFMLMTRPTWVMLYDAVDTQDPGPGTEPGTEPSLPSNLETGFSESPVISPLELHWYELVYCCSSR